MSVSGDIWAHRELLPDGIQPVHTRVVHVTVLLVLADKPFVLTHTILKHTKSLLKGPGLIHKTDRLFITKFNWLWIAKQNNAHHYLTKQRVVKCNIVHIVGLNHLRLQHGWKKKFTLILTLKLNQSFFKSGTISFNELLILPKNGLSPNLADSAAENYNPFAILSNPSGCRHVPVFLLPWRQHRASCSESPSEW